MPGTLPITSGTPIRVHPVGPFTEYLLVVSNSSGQSIARDLKIHVAPSSEDPWSPTNLPEPTAARMKEEVDVLADPGLRGRLTGQPGCIQAATYIAGRMQTIGLTPVSGPGMGGETPYHCTYTVPFTSSNLVGLIPGTDPSLKDEYVVFTAHYDHIGTQGGVVIPGANDNASGVAGILEAARLLISSNPKRSILILAVSGEELGLYGSAAFVTHPPVPRDRIIANINLDMIGRGSPGEYHVTPATVAGKVTTLVKDARRAAAYHAIPLSAGIDQYFRQSDHYSFAKMGIPAIFLHDGEDTDYHNPADTADKIDYGKMVTLVRLARDLGYVTANAPQRPQLVPETEYRAWSWGPFTHLARPAWPPFLTPDPPISASGYPLLPAWESPVSAPALAR